MDVLDRSARDRARLSLRCCVLSRSNRLLEHKLGLMDSRDFGSQWSR
jgi:hypothetical protein